MTISEKAVNLHAQGNNCAQSVLRACSEYTGLDETVAFGIANGFGGGVRSGEICGAISGGVMAIGLNMQSKGITNIAGTTKAYVEKFKNRYGCVRCIELKGRHISCDELISAAAELAEKYCTGD